MARASDAVEKAAAKKMLEATSKRRELAKYYRNEEKVDIYLSPTYQPYFGRVMRVTINGVSIYFPVNGTTHAVPKTFADEITSRRMKIDEIITKQTRMADIPVNMDASTPGDTQLF